MLDKWERMRRRESKRGNTGAGEKIGRGEETVARRRKRKGQKAQEQRGKRELRK